MSRLSDAEIDEIYNSPEFYEDTRIGYNFFYRAFARAIIAAAGAKDSEDAQDAASPKERQLRAAVSQVCEGWTLPDGVRKILETALWTDAAMQEQKGA